MLLSHINKKDNKKILLDLLDKHLEIEDKFLSLFQNDEINIKDLIDISKSIIKLRDEDIEDINENIILVKDRKFDDELLKNYEEIKKEISSIYSYLEEDKTPILNLDKIKSFISSFSKLVKDEYDEKDIDINNHIVILSNKEEKVPLCFQNGRKIVMTKTNFDISIFTRDELIEILRFLDIIVTDNSYDYLRSEISKQIESISNISILKK